MTVSVRPDAYAGTTQAVLHSIEVLENNVDADYVTDTIRKNETPI